MDKIINIYWIRHALSDSNVATAKAIQKVGCHNNYKLTKSLDFGKSYKYPRDSFLTKFAQRHCVEVFSNLDVVPDIIISSQLLRTIQTATLYKNYSGSKIPLLAMPYIAELGTHANGQDSRTLLELHQFIKNFNYNVTFAENPKRYLEESSIVKFYKRLVKLVSKYNKKELNVFVFTHGGFIENFVSKSKSKNLDIWKQKHFFVNNKLLIHTPFRYKTGVGKSRGNHYYCHPNNFGLTVDEFDKI